MALGMALVPITSSDPLGGTDISCLCDFRIRVTVELPEGDSSTSITGTMFHLKLGLRLVIWDSLRQEKRQEQKLGVVDPDDEEDVLHSDDLLWQPLPCRVPAVKGQW